MMELETILRTETAFDNLDFSNSSTEHIVLGDFNIHHSTWGGIHIRPDKRSDELLHIIDQFSLIQHLPQGTTTYISPHGSESTLDLLFTTFGLKERIFFCNVREDLDHDSDYFPIETIIDISIKQTGPRQTYCYDRTDMKILMSELEKKLPNPPSTLLHPFPDATLIDIFTTHLAKAISEAIEDSTPKTKISPRLVSGFDGICKEACTACN